MKTIGFGIVGCGYFGSEYGRILNEMEGTRTVAVLGGKDDDSARRLSERLQCDEAASLEELVRRSDIDAIVVASPNHMHKEPVLLAAEQGKHVFCEKPIALHIADCEAMIEACRKASVRFMAGHIMHFMSGVREVKRWIAAGRIGTPIVGHAEKTGWEDANPLMSWKQNRALTGGHLFHQIHELDLLQAFMGPAAAVSMAGLSLDPESPPQGADVLLLTLRFADGRVASMQYGSAFRWGEHYVKVGGTEGAVLFDFVRSEIVLKAGGNVERIAINGQPDEDEERVRSYSQSQGKIVYGSGDSRPALFLRRPMEREMAYFRDVLRGKPIDDEFMPLFDGSSARSSIATAHYALASLAEKRWVDVPPAG